MDGEILEKEEMPQAGSDAEAAGSMLKMLGVEVEENAHDAFLKELGITDGQLPPRLVIGPTSRTNESLTPSDFPQESSEQFFDSLTLDDRVNSFVQEGAVTLVIDGQKKRLRIRSVSLQVFQELLEALRPKAEPWRRKGQMVTDEAELRNHSPRYDKAMTEYYQLVGPMRCLLGTPDLDLYHRGDLVWAKDGSVRDVRRAVQALKNMGLSDTQFTYWNNQIQELAAEAQEDEKAEEARFFDKSASS